MKSLLLLPWGDTMKFVCAMTYVALFALSTRPAIAEALVGDAGGFVPEALSPVQLHPKHGKIDLQGGMASLDVAAEFGYLSPEEAETVLVKMWGNPPHQKKPLGMLIPADLPPTGPTSRNGKSLSTRWCSRAAAAHLITVISKMPQVRTRNPRKSWNAARPPDDCVLQAARSSWRMTSRVASSETTKLSRARKVSSTICRAVLPRDRPIT